MAGVRPPGEGGREGAGGGWGVERAAYIGTCSLPPQRIVPRAGALGGVCAHTMCPATSLPHPGGPVSHAHVRHTLPIFPFLARRAPGNIIMEMRVIHTGSEEEGTRPLPRHHTPPLIHTHTHTCYRDFQRECVTLNAHPFSLKNGHQDLSFLCLARPLYAVLYAVPAPGAWAWARRTRTWMREGLDE